MSDWFDSLDSLNDKMLALVNGVYIGIVTDNKDPEKLGRVKVKIPVIDDQNSLDWARVATLMAGSGRGTLFVPEVGDEVVVAFQMGDIRMPIVIGALWNKQEKPPEGKDDQNNIRKIRTRLGHEVIFDDTKGSGKLTIKTAEGHQMEIDEKAATIQLREKSGNNTITIKGGSANEIEIKSGASKITVNNKGDAELQTAKSVKIKAAQISIEASATLDLKASAALNLKCDGMVTVKGAMVKIN